MRLLDDPDTVLIFPTKGGGIFELTRGQLDRFSDTYTGMDVRRELKKAAAWLDLNPSKLKTCGGMLRFLNRWLARADEAAKTRRDLVAEERARLERDNKC